MKNLTVNIEDISRVKEFVNLVSRCDSEVDLVAGRYQVDAKSIMGIFSLDLAKPVELKYYESVDEDPAQFEKFKESIAKFIVND